MWIYFAPLAFKYVFISCDNCSHNYGEKCLNLKSGKFIICVPNSDAISG